MKILSKIASSNTDNDDNIHTSVMFTIYIIIRGDEHVSGNIDT